MWITDAAGLAAACDRCRAESYCTLDVEFYWRDTYRPQVALVQLATPAGEVFLVDPLALPDAQPLAALLRAPDCLKVLHSGSQDLMVLRQYAGAVPAPLLDTQIAAGFAGLGYGIGYARLVEQVSGVVIGKELQNSDWRQRPLTEAQLEYARDDVRHLLVVTEWLRARLTAAGRWDWALAECAAQLAAAEDEFAHPEPPYRRIAGHGRLDARALAILKLAAAWREAYAAEVDRPPRWIATDGALLDLARRQPQSASELDAVGELPPRVRQRQGPMLLDCVCQALALPVDELERPAHGARPTPAQQEQVKALLAVVRTAATEAGLPPEMLAPRRLVEALVFGPQPPTDNPVLQGWRNLVVGDRVRAVLASAPLLDGLDAVPAPAVAE